MNRVTLIVICVIYTVLLSICYGALVLAVFLVPVVLRLMS